ncbi:MAG: CCA tRNA nucleotidyltransferase [bacterium]|jgi:tRNA nucleotidyltransferase (CCA-adding enzyme)
MFREIPAPVLEVIKKLKEKKHQAYLVGGCVRDMLRGIEPKDWDVATSAVPEVVQGLFPRVIPTGIQFGTVTVLMAGEGIEVTTFRRDGVYRDGRHPSTVTFGTDVEADLLRRDFTINALAYDPVEERLLDPTGGIADLRAGLVRAVGDPCVRFREDALRLLRAIRFAGQIGGAIEPGTWTALCRLSRRLQFIAPERIQQELDKILLQEPLQPSFNRLEKSGLLLVIFPALYKQTRHPLPVSLKTCTLVSPLLHLRLAGLLSGITDPAFQLLSLKYPKELSRRVGHLVTSLARLPREGTDLAAARHYLCRLGRDHLPDLLQLAAALEEAGGFEPGIQHRINRFLEALGQVTAEDFPLSPDQLALDGRMLMDHLGIAPGPLIGKLRRLLWEEVLQDPRRNRREYLLTRGRQLAAQGEKEGRVGAAETPPAGPRE